MSLFKKFKNDSKSQAMELLDSSVGMAEEMQKMHSDLFPFGKLSLASSDFEKFATVSTNETVAKAVSATLDQVSTQSSVLSKLDCFITLHIPTIEDGGNFGVGVQLDLVKKLGEMKETANKATEALLGYQSARAEALGKLNLPSKSYTVTQSESETKTDGKSEKKESVSKEEKESGSPSSGPSYDSRLAAVVAVDTLYYSKASGIFSQSIISFMGVMDFVDKNKGKLLEPKGRSGGSNFSMY
mmetsp:Transcript_7118/g.17374  ORF Transcript_7118/g.17374 Transcript_7118/m.17374 type:complete len:242 (+) Transcript_7118:184-909(+)